MSKAFISVEGVSKWYPYKGSAKAAGKPLNGRGKDFIKACDDIDLTIERGEILGIIGESGCGKSTLAKVLTRLEEPTSGDCFIDGVSTKDMIKKDARAFRRQVQMVFQNPFDTFTPRDTIAKILMRPMKIHGIGASDDERWQKCCEALEANGLTPADDIMERFPHELSGGQLQRISIIRSMFLEPSFIIADEPVSMLDVSVRADIINMLIDLAEQKDAAVMFISHDIALTRYISDHIAVMYLGRVVEYGTADDVIKNPMHPYTRALISNCASIDPFEVSESIEIEGEPPTPLNPGPGCYFAERCSEVCEACHKSYPERIELENGHWYTCFQSR
ncbi:MAG: ABC transporter ATP-binding protein [Eubacterium sp.]|nr:ABC transporter ATP-binding protein [Eubacterium sp.]